MESSQIDFSPTPNNSPYRAYSISWNITKRCNLNCEHCYLDADFRGGFRVDELTTQECYNVIDQIAEVNPNAFLILTGGEPLLRPDIYDITRYAADRKFMVVLGTNGTIINRENAQKIKDAGAHGVGISIDSMDPGKHDQFRGVSKAWEKSMEAFDILNDVGVDFLIQMSVSDMNYKEIPDVIAYAEKIGAVAFNLYFLVCTGRGQGNTDISNAAYEEALKILYQEQMKYKGRLMINSKCAPQYKRVVYENDPDSVYQRTYAGGCPAGTHYSRISPEGDLTPCPFIAESVGNLKSDTFQNLWYNAPLMNQLRERKGLDGKCGSCEFSAMCSGCRARAFAETGNYMAEDPSCDYEPGQHGGKAIELKVEDTLGLEVEYRQKWTPEAKQRLERIPSFARGMVVQGIEKFAAERGVALIDEHVVKKSREEMIEKRGAMFPFLKKFINSEKS
ncbi:Radical SAM domain protein, putative Coenzyme PQQ synthesis protein E [Nitrospina gracilis 3/211]|uniref:Radical SAM domain protein, putative Coenzyme PQQ synthesis protein E n=1 Tax=Nitrospina gracilis (strain 3/211) TaxID=1266370 RepID=M1ZCN4_NITG3|nr:MULTISPECIES: radical SAM/SPASM domain-containing protein [Nitrospina]MCF8724002.1 radical SAM protein with 4Fe4S-binding SPASM domain [Nitrospina sp. Nb-3]CCQ91128.1 Radical SAM domain protein, putative Coenzyme PQQ synthesis protein E [Nitrospina gracilis 3/211]